MNVQSPHKWRYTIKSAVFGSSSSLLLLGSEGGGLVCEWVGMLICGWIILTASSRRRLMIYHSLVIHLLVLQPRSSGVSLIRLGPLWWH